MTIGERIQMIRGTQSREKFAGLTDVSKNTLVNYEKGDSSPTSEYLNRVLRLHPDISPSWLLTGEGQMLRSTEHAETVAEQQSAPVYRYADSADLGKEYTLVPRYNVKVSAGGGALIESEQVVDHLAFKTAWIHNVMHLAPSDLLLVSAMGDSMFPTIKPGDLLLVDKSQVDVKDGQIYVLRLDDSLVAKRIQRLAGGGMHILSDNPVYKAQAVSADMIDAVQIIGRVVWAGGRM